MTENSVIPCQNPDPLQGASHRSAADDEYVREELDEVYIIYTKMINAFKMEADMFQLLPLQREEYTHKNLKGYSDRMTFHPSGGIGAEQPDSKRCVWFCIWCSWWNLMPVNHNSRMMAMQTATDSAKQMLHVWKLNTTVCVRQRSLRKSLRSLQGAKAQRVRKSKRGEAI